MVGDNTGLIHGLVMHNKMFAAVDAAVERVLLWVVAAVLEKRLEEKYMLVSLVEQMKGGSKVPGQELADKLQIAGKGVEVLDMW